MDIDFRCTNPSIEIRNLDERTEVFHPVQLSRIHVSAGTALSQHRPDQKYIMDNALLYPTTPSSTNGILASTFCSDTELLLWQQQVTGSDIAWNDIVLLEVLLDTADGRMKGLVKDVVNDWSIDSLTEQGFNLVNVEAATLIVMHELIHSTAMGLGKAISM
jgi:hypothetical protein